MAFYGPKQTLSASITIGTTSTLLGRFINATGAVAILVRFSAGSNSTNPLSAAGGQCCDAGATAANVTGFLLAPSGTASCKTNGTAPDGGYLLFVPTVGPMVPTPCVDIYATMTTAVSNTVKVEAWGLYSDTEQRHTHLASLSAAG